MSRIEAWLARVPRGPWARRAAAAAAGLGAAFAHPPFGVLIGLAGYALLFHLADSTEGPRPVRSAFLRGWLAGAAYFFVGCWWVAEAFLVDAEGQGWMAPIAIILLPGGLGLFWGAACALHRRFRPDGGYARLIAFAGWLTALEWTRGHIFTGFPWNLPGETWAAGSAPSQAASLVGAYGLTWITILAAAALAAPFGPKGRRGGLYAVAAAGALVLGLYAYGAVRLSVTMAIKPGAPLVRIVQANIEQETKYDAARFRDIVVRYAEWTARPAARTPDIVIWPEGAIPAAVDDYLASGTWPLALIRDSLRPGQSLVLGGYRAGEFKGGPAYFNSLIALKAEPEGLRVTGLYDKHRLVPFGEFLPAEPVMEALGLKNLAKVGDGFSPGPPPAPIAMDGAPRVQPLICYEVLFPGLVRDAIRRGPRPRWIVNVSNDAWYGPTSGPWQHLNIASYRAIENGLPMARATPTGVSAMVDSFGRTTAHIGLGKAGILDVTLPEPLSPTIYTQIGDIPLLVMLFASFAALLRAPPALSLRLSRLHRKN